MTLLGDEVVKILMDHEKIEETAKYTTRETAGGMDIVDDTLTYVKKIQGDTVKSKNIFNRYGTRQPVGATASEITDKSITIKQTVGGTYKFYAFPIENPEQYVGKTLYISAKWTNSSANKGSIRICWYKDGTWSWNTAHGYTSGAVVSGVVPTKPNGASGLYVMLYANTEGTGVANNTVTYTDIMVSTENIAYQPYFDGLKNAYIDSIKSVGRNLFTFNGRKAYSQYITTKIVNSNEVVFTSNNQKTGSVQCWFRIPNLIVGKKYVVSLKATTKNNPVDGDPNSLNRLMVMDGLSNPTYLISSPLGDEDFEDKAVKFTFTARVANDTQIGFYATNTKATFSNYYARLYDVQIETDEQTEFTPYVEDIYQLPEPIELGKWDYIDVERKKIVRATKPAFVIDGVNKKLRSADTYATNFWLMDYRTSGDSKDLAEIIADNFTSRVISPTTTNNEGVYIANNGNSVYFWIRKSLYPEITDTASANAYFAEHPCTVTYRMSTETEEDIDIPETYKAWNKGNETIEQGATDNSIYGAELTVTKEYLTKLIFGEIYG